jgi:hypothetical protein
VLGYEKDKIDGNETSEFTYNEEFIGKVKDCYLRFVCSMHLSNVKQTNKVGIL